MIWINTLEGGLKKMALGYRKLGRDSAKRKALLRD